MVRTLDNLGHQLLQITLQHYSIMTIGTLLATAFTINSHLKTS